MNFPDALAAVAVQSYQIIIVTALWSITGNRVMLKTLA